ncbi:N-acetyltransferase family protein [Actinotalea sp.]|uniref:GNAT family N-acetyltransferase n=1 Tax=Actinotalea sp. TaxID=1872145 RepID=UPI00356548CD
MRPVEVAAACPADLDELAQLCLTAREESSVGPQVCSPHRDVLAQQLGALASVPGGIVLVARADGQAVGLLLGRLVGPNPFTDEMHLAVEAVYVVPSQRRRGVGHALMVGATQTAAEAGAVHVYAAPIPGARGMQRFFVRLGFQAAAAHRVSTLTALQRRLTQDTSRAPRRVGPRHLDDLIAWRRQTRGTTGEVPVIVPTLGEAQPDARSAMSTQVNRAVQIRAPRESTTTTS